MTKIEQIYSFISEADGTVSKSEMEKQFDASYLSLTLHKLVSEGRVDRVGRGEYCAVRGMPRDIFECGTDMEAEAVRSTLVSAFPGVRICVWSADSAFLKLSDLLLPQNITVIECARESTDAIWKYLLSRMPDILISPASQRGLPSREQGSHLLVIHPLVSDAPFRKAEDGFMYPRIEKILVDILCESHFEFLERKDIDLVWRNAFSDYIVDRDTLLRYAGRRNKEELAKEIMNTMVIRPKRLSLFDDWRQKPAIPLPRWLLWDYDVEASYINWDNMKTLIAERTVVMGGMDEWYYFLQRYNGKDNASEIVKKIKKIDNQWMMMVKFSMDVLGIDKKDMYCLNRVEPWWRTMQ